MVTELSTEDVPLVTGAGAGVGAWVLGYLITYVWQAGTVREQLRAFNFLAELLGGEPVPAWIGIGWYYYNAHFVSTLVPGFGGTRAENFIAAADGGALSLLYILPPAVLLVSSAVTVGRAEASTRLNAAVAGGSVTLGYLPLCIVGMFVFVYSVGEATVRPDGVTAVLLAGIVYPVVFGGLGGVLADGLEF